VQKIEVSPEAIGEYNHYIQLRKPEEQRQYSFEKLGIKDWEIVELSGEEILNLGTFVETSGAVPASYFFWKNHGRNVSLGGLIEEVVSLKDDEISDIAKQWVREILNYNENELEEEIKSGEIDPPLLFCPLDTSRGLDKGLLNLGNILDGNSRLKQIARYLYGLEPEDVKEFKMYAFIGHVDLRKYILFNTYYLAEPWIDKAKNLVNKFLGKDTERIDKEHIMKFYERWYLLLQRIGYYD
jgi:hypothetical protein